MAHLTNDQYDLLARVEELDESTKLSPEFLSILAHQLECGACQTHIDEARLRDNLDAIRERYRKEHPEYDADMRAFRENI